VEYAQEVFQVSERRVCRALEQPRSTQRYHGKGAEDEEMLTERIVILASQYGRYGYRRITAMLQLEGWQVNHKRVEHIWCQEGLKVPKKQPKWGRLWLNDGSSLRLRSEYPDHVWSYDFVLERTHDRRAFWILNVIDEYTRECLAIRVERNLDHEDVQECLAELFCTRGVPAHLRSDNGPEFIANQLRQWLSRLGVLTLFIEPGSPWENGYIESFNGKMRDELLDREIFFTLEEAKTLIVRWREEYNHIRPHSALGYRPPAPQAWLLFQQPFSNERALT
jgi:transposase InsO family protein